MKTIKLIFVALLVSSTTFSQYVLKEGYIEHVTADDFRNSFTYKKLALFPLFAGKNFKDELDDIGKYTTLEEALKNKKVRITESGNGGGQVNKLYIENISSDTIYIMAGEVVKGGKQDRVIADDMVLMPGSGKIDLSVYCVEHHRWSYKSDRNFSDYYAVSSNSVRKKAAVEKDQGGVWDEVAKVTEKQNAETGTGTYTALEQSEEYQGQLKTYLDYFMKSFDKLDDCIGFVGISGDKIIGCDIFATKELFEKQKKNLLNAYITEALSHGKTAKIDFKKVMDYLKDFLSDTVNQDEKINEKGMQYEYKGKKMHINVY